MSGFPRQVFAPHLIRGFGGLLQAILKLRQDTADAVEGVTPILGPLLPTWIPAPNPALDANTDAAFQANNSIVEWSCTTGDRLFDPRTAPSSMAFTFWKSSIAAHKITIDVLTGGAAGWTTDAGLNLNFDLPGSSGATGQWLIRIDLPNKRVNVIPAS